MRLTLHLIGRERGFLSGASRCDRESYVGNEPMGDHRYTEIIHAFNWDTRQSFRKEKIKTTRGLRGQVVKRDILNQLSTSLWDGFEVKIHYLLTDHV